MTQKIAENKKYNAIAFRCWIEEKGYKKSTTGWFETIYADAPGPYTSRKISHIAKTDSELYDIFATSQQDPESVCPICDGRGGVSYYTGEDGGKEKGEQVEVTPEAAAMAKEMMNDLAAKAIAPSVEADQQVPEEIKEWIRVNGRKIENRVYDLFDAAEDMGIAMYHKMQEEVKDQKAKQTALVQEIATLKESFKSSTYQHDQDMEIVKGERNELRDLLNIINEGYSDHFTNFLNDRISEALNKFTNKEKDNAPS